MFYNVPPFSVKLAFCIFQVYGLIFANSANNKMIISTFNVENCIIAKVYYRHH